MIRAVVVLTMVAGCDAVFPVSPGHVADAARGDALGADAMATADAGVVDAGGPDAPCGYRCFAPDMTAGVPNIGMAACEAAMDDTCIALPQLLPIDLCTCSAGLPELYVLPGPSDSTVLVALLAPLPPGSGWSLIVNDDGVCRGGAAPCTNDGPCYPATFLYAWDAIPINLGQNNSFKFSQDDGSGCLNGWFAFTVPL